MAKKNGNLHTAKREKNDEFYTQLADIENELKHYTEHFRGKVVYCNCDDPITSNFYKYFATNFKKLGLKKVPVIVADDLSEEQVKAFRLADNKTSEFSVWDNKKLLEELEKIDKAIYTGFVESDIFSDILDEKDNEPTETNKKGLTYSLKFSTQNEELFERIKMYIEEVSDLEQ